MTRYRPYMMTPEEQRLDLLAATQIIADAEVAHCWELIRDGLQSSKLGTGNFGTLLAHLRAGNGMTLDELTIEVDPPGGDRALVAILDDQRTCSAPALIQELERLAARAGGSGPPGHPSSDGEAPAGAPPDTGSTASSAPDLLGLLAGLLGTTPDRLAGDPAAYRAHVERV